MTLVLIQPGLPAFAYCTHLNSHGTQPNFSIKVIHEESYLDWSWASHIYHPPTDKKLKHARDFVTIHSICSKDHKKQFNMMFKYLVAVFISRPPFLKGLSKNLDTALYSDELWYLDLVWRLCAPLYKIFCYSWRLKPQHGNGFFLWQ